MLSVLVVEDSVETQLLLKRSLETKYNVICSYDLNSARQNLVAHEVDLVLLDLELPDGKGLSLFDELSRGSGVPKIPTIILSASSDTKTKVNGLTLGADDFIAKPFDKLELLARIESVLRRGPTRGNESRLSLADVLLDFEKQTAFHLVDGHELNVGLTPIEFRIFTHLCKTLGSENSRDELKKHVWGETFISERNIDTHICKLRKKLDATKIEISNRRGKGYVVKVTEHVPAEPPTALQPQLPAFGINSKIKFSPSGTAVRS